MSFHNTFKKYNVILNILAPKTTTYNLQRPNKYIKHMNLQRPNKNRK